MLPTVLYHHVILYFASSDLVFHFPSTTTMSLPPRSPGTVSDDCTFVFPPSLSPPVEFYCSTLHGHFIATEDVYTVPHDYLNEHDLLTDWDRASLIGWVIGIHHDNTLPQDILYTAVNMIDRFLSFEPLFHLDTLRLIGIVCLWISHKYHGTRGTCLLDVPILVQACNNAYTAAQVRCYLSSYDTVLHRMHCLSPFLF